MKHALVLILLLAALRLSAQITSTFDVDSDGWTFTAVATPITVNYQSTGGNPGGYASVTYASNAAATVQNWIAPAKFRGSHLVRSLGMSFKFDLQQSVAGSGAGFDVIIRNGSNNIYLSGITPKPAVAPAWTSYSFKLDETGGWIYSAGATVATRYQIQSILANVTSIEIRGTYATNAAYVSGIDNVVLEQRILAPAPVGSTLSVSSGKPGDVVTINGGGFDPIASNNKVFFGSLAGTEAQVQSASATQLTVVVPVGAVYGPLTITNTTTGLTGKTSTPFNPVFDGGGRIIPASFKSKFSIATIGIEGWYFGDFDGDGWEDFAVTNNNAEDYIDLYRNLGQGGKLSAASFAPKVTVAAPQTGGSGTNGAGLAFVDLDGDGKKDAITSNSTSAFNSAFITLRNTSTPGSFSFEAPEYWPGASDETPPFYVGDIDGDGRPELVGGEGSSGVGTNLFISQNISTPGNIEIGPPVGYFGSTVDGLSEVQMGDLNNDGKPDMIASWSFGDRFSIIQNYSTPGTIAMTDMGQISTGQYNRGMKIVDVDFDGKNDLIWKKTGGGIYIRLNGDTDGVLDPTDFVTEIILTSDLGANGAPAFVDFNGDGKVDIASTDDADVGIYESVYTGGPLTSTSFSPAYQVLGTGSSSGGPGISDFNHDGKPDIVVAAGSSITILENANIVGPTISVNTVSPLAGPVNSIVTITGNNFSTVPTYNHVYFGFTEATIVSATASEIKVRVPLGATYGPVSVRVGELSSRYRLPFAPVFSSGVTFNATHFGTPINFNLPAANYDIEVGDLNRDGLLDVLAEGSGGYTFQNTHVPGPITSSSLGAAVQLTNSFINPRLEDLDGDGLIDAAAANGIAYKNNSTTANISFYPQTSLGLGASLMDFGDFNLDGKPDIAVTVDVSGTSDFIIQENWTANTTGNFTTGTYGSFSGNNFFTKPAPFGGVIAEDFDGDGYVDAATTNPNTDNVSIYPNLGALKISGAQFGARTDITVSDAPNRMYKADFDRDGKVDLLLNHANATTTVSVLYNTSTLGNISFSRFDITTPSAAIILAVGDLDGDGKPEIFSSSEPGNRVSIYKNIHATGPLTAASFATPFNLTVTAPRGITTGDLNLDGKPELIISRAAGLLVVYENLIPNTFPTITSFTPTSGPTGTTVVITGTNFDPVPANNTVMFNGATAVVSASTSTSITVKVPAAATTGPITVTVGGNTATSSTNFVVTPPPAITSFSPTSTLAGSTVVITGTNFSPTPADIAVTINGVPAIITASTSTTISVTVPAGAGTGPIAVTIGTNTATSSGSFVESIAPTITVDQQPSSAVICENSATGMTVAASGTTNLTYQWQYATTSGGPFTNVIDGGGYANATTANLSISNVGIFGAGFYRCLIGGDLAASVLSNEAQLTVNALPAKQAIASSVTPVGNIVTVCSPGSVTLSAPNGFTGYNWSNGGTTPQITVTASGTYTVYVMSAQGCPSPTSDAITVVFTSGACPTNTPPVFATTSQSAPIRGTASIDLTSLISDPDNNVVITSLSIVAQPTSGATASIVKGILILDYSNVSFTGKDVVVVQVCDALGACTQSQVTIDVVGNIQVYDAVSPNGDNKNDFFFIEFVDVFPETRENTVTIYNRWGDIVFEVTDYDNITRVFKGQNKNGNELPSGTYFYKIKFKGAETLTGYLSLKR